MILKRPGSLGVIIIVALNVVGAFAQLRPEVTPPATKPSKPAQILIQTSPNAEVYLDDTFKGKASAQGRLVIENPQPGQHALRISLSGKKDYEHPVNVLAGQVARVNAVLADVQKPENLGPAPGRARENPKDGLKYVWIPPGSFMMGCSPGDSECGGDEKPAHQVTITRGFWMGQTPVTVGAYKRFARATGRSMPPEPNILGRALNPGWGNEAMPIVDVTWDEAQAYCGWVGGRLPTEAEWEYAARGGSTKARYGALDDVAWYGDNSGLQHLDSTRIWNEDQKNYVQRLKDNNNGMHAVGLKRPNPFGLYDVLGNVWQWVNDWYNANYYQSSPAQDPPGPASGQLRVLRGGSWGVDPWGVRVSGRYRVSPTDRSVGVGFRCSGEVGSP